MNVPFGEEHSFFEALKMVDEKLESAKQLEINFTRRYWKRKELLFSPVEDALESMLKLLEDLRSFEEVPLCRRRMYNHMKWQLQQEWNRWERAKHQLRKVWNYEE